MSRVDGRRHSLQLPQSALSDAAEYSVKCGGAKSKGQLTVEGAKTLECAWILRIFANSKISEPVITPRII